MGAFGAVAQVLTDAPATARISTRGRYMQVGASFPTLRIPPTELLA